jgi:hypothetical protein
MLASAKGLGHYTPAVALAHEIHGAGYYCRLEVFERMLDVEGQSRLARQQRSLWEKPRMLPALNAVAARMPSAVSNTIVDSIVAEWHKANVSDFVVFSGAWLFAVRRYGEQRGVKPNVRCLHVDSVPSPSWDADFGHEFEHDWMHQPGQLFTIRRPSAASKEPRRLRRILLHGGGWHLSELSKAIDEVKNAGFSVLANANRPIHASSQERIEFRIDPAWNPLDRTLLSPNLPKLQIRRRMGRQTFAPTARSMHSLMRTSLATVSKPGGATLIESLETACPLVFLPTEADHERQNERVWVELGFGVRWDAWRDAGFDARILSDLRQRLIVAQASARQYIDELLDARR